MIDEYIEKVMSGAKAGKNRTLERTKPKAKDTVCKDTLDKAREAAATEKAAEKKLEKAAEKKLEKAAEKKVEQQAAKKAENFVARKVGKQVGKKAGRGLGQRIGRAIPVIGAGVTAWFWVDDVEQKGFWFGTANSILDAVPLAGSIKAIYEIPTGRDIIPDK